MPAVELDRFSVGGRLFPSEAPQDTATGDDFATTVQIVDQLRKVKKPAIVRDILEETLVCSAHYTYIA